MPPKAKFDREEISAAALQIVKEQGMSALTARELGKQLGTSSRPVFTAFRDMDEVKRAAGALALEELTQQILQKKERGADVQHIMGMLVECGQKEPECFKLIFMQQQEGGEPSQNGLQGLGEIAALCEALLQEKYELPPQTAHDVLEQLWAQAFGWGALCALGFCSLPQKEIDRRLDGLLVSVVEHLRSSQTTSDEPNKQTRENVSAKRDAAQQENPSAAAKKANGKDTTKKEDREIGKEEPEHTQPKQSNAGGRRKVQRKGTP